MSVGKKIKQKMLRVSHLNILKGGKERLNHILKVIKTIDPDICGILEAVGARKEIKNLEKEANNLGYNLFRIAIAKSKYNIAVFSRVPLKINTIKKGFHHVVLHAVLKDGLFRDVSIFFIHFSPVSEDFRLKEVKYLFRHIKKNQKVIIMGDFNSLSPHDPYDRKNILEIFRKNNIAKYGTDKLRFDVISKIESLKLIDAAHYFKYPFVATTPTLSNKDISHATDIRIDYAFLTKNLLKYFKKIKVFKNPVADKASDHYPLIIELSK